MDMHVYHAAHAAPRPDPVRIAGIAGALVLNAAALMLMLAPLDRAGRDPAPPRGLQAEWFEPRPVPPPPPPEVVPVVRPAVVPAPAAPARRVVAPDPAPVAPPVVEGGTLAADPLPPAGDPGADGGGAGPGPGPMTGVQLAYAEAGAPPYPRTALRSGHQGTVTLQVLVDVDGRPLEVQVHAGSGYRQLDEAARRHVLRHWRFHPAMRDGRAVQAIGLVPIEFRLDRG